MTSRTIEHLAQRLKTYPHEPLYIEGFRQAAILVPLLVSQNGLEFLFTVRSSTLSSHAGQISFPGGRLDAGETVTEAALRESYEEIALKPENVQILGQLSDHPSPARYIVTPIVALIQPQEFTLSVKEVDSIFTIPLTELSQIVPYTEDRHLWGHTRRLHFYRWQEHLIWGLTGNVVKTLLELFNEAPIQSH